MESILELIDRYKGFEIVLGFINDEDHIVGGTGNDVWYCITKGKKRELWLGTFNGKWRDQHIIVKGDDVKYEEAEEGSTLKMVNDRLFFGKDHIEKDGRKPVEIEERGMKLLHYTYNFGETAYDVSAEYGVTVSYSYIEDTSVGFRFRDIQAGDKLKAPTI